jgi:hypothetical protein
MFRRILIYCCVLFVALTQSGCIGLIVQTPKECKIESNSTGAHDSSGEPPGLNDANATPSTKEEVSEVWGKPDEIITVSENVETWVYKKTLWCGVWPIIILPIPFVLPVCNGFERIGFRGNEGICIHSRQTDYSVDLGLLIPVPGAGMAASGGGLRKPSSSCQYPVLSGPTYSKISNIPDNKGLVYFYRQNLTDNNVTYAVGIFGIMNLTIYNNGYSSYFSDPGSNEFCVNFARSCVTIDVKPGQAYYIKMEIQSDSKPKLVIINPEVAEKEISGCRRYKTLLTAN